MAFDDDGVIVTIGMSAGDGRRAAIVLLGARTSEEENHSASGAEKCQRDAGSSAAAYEMLQKARQNAEAR